MDLIETALGSRTRAIGSRTVDGQKYIQGWFFDDGMMRCLEEHMYHVFKRKKPCREYLVNVVCCFHFGICFVLVGMAGMGLGECPCFSCMKIMPFQDALLEVKGCSSLACLKKITLSYGSWVPKVARVV